MSTTEDKLQKLKVAELKELLAKHHLVQTGKKDELVKRLLENHISADGEVDGAEGAAPVEEELVEAPSEEQAAPPTTSTPSAPPAPAPSGETSSELSPELAALKARAERFGLPFDPKAHTKPSTPSAKPASTNGASAPAAAPTSAAAPADTSAKKERPGAIDKDKSSLGLSDEVLARRAAKFGLPEKKSEPVLAKEQKAKEVKPPSAKALQTADAEITPEMAAKIAEEEEKRRKRAEKFGPVGGIKHKADGEASAVEPEAKKSKV